MRALILVIALLLPLGAFAAKKPAKPVRPMKVPPGKPEIFELSPRGIQRGVSSKIKLVGTNLIGLTELHLQNSKLQGHLLLDPKPTSTEAWINLLAASDLTRGPYEISVKNTNSESSKLKLYVDDLPQVYESSKTTDAKPLPLKTPFSYWGTLNPAGNADDVEFEARSGDALVFEAAAKSIGSKAGVMITVFDSRGALLASSSGFDGGDPLLRVPIVEDGRYRVRVADKMDSGSREHFYRLSVGTFPVVVGCFPLGVPANKESEVELIGLNLPAHASVRVHAGNAGEMDVPVDLEKFRLHRPLKVAVSDGTEMIEIEPNDVPAQSMKVPVPCVVDGRLNPNHSQRSAASGADSDQFQFTAKVGHVLVLETEAARRGSPVDTKIEILYPDGKPVERLILQAVRDSHLTFRNIDSVTDDLRVENWQEMELNQLMYLQGEVCKIFRMPQGPDSGFQFYNSGGKRVDYFDTTAIAHPLDEPCFVVEPHPPGTKLVENGLPVFPIYYCNDDDASRQLGTDSRLLFDPPADGNYLVRVTDGRGFGGARFVYRLIIRDAKPDYSVKLNGVNPTVNAGSGREFSVSADRIDGFDGDIRVTVTNLPPGFSVSSPIVIQAGHLEAKATINAAADAMQPVETNMTRIQVTATAVINGQTVEKEVASLGKIKLAEKPKLFVALEPYREGETNFVERSIGDPPQEVTIVPGQTLPVWLKIKRNGHEELVTFNVDSLPHGVIVDNIGLNGVLIPKGQDARRIFLSAAKWVPDIDRLCFARSVQAENQTSLPLLLHVRKPASQAAR